MGCRIRLRLSESELLVNKQETLTAAKHVLRQRRALGSERHLPRWLSRENLSQRLGQLRVEQSSIL